VCGIFFVLVAWILRERRVKAERESLRAFHGLSEDIIAAPEPAAIAEKLAKVLPTVTQATSAAMYLYQRRTKSLERVPTSADPEPMAASIEAPPEGLANAAVVCFRNRTLLNIPDVRRNPLVKAGAKLSLPRSAMFVPLSNQQDTLGVLEVVNSRKPGFFTPEEQADVQHLANQAAAALKLQERQAMREQLFQSEKLAATGQLISGVVSELRAPLDTIVKLSASLAAHQGVPATPRDLLKLAGESQRAFEIVSRLVSFAREDESEPHLVDVNAAAAELIDFRVPEWKALGLRGQNRIAVEPTPVLASRGQLEQVLLNLLVHAEQRASQSSGKSISIQSSAIAQKAVVEIEYSTTADEPSADPFSAGSQFTGDALGLGVCQSIARSHGGEIRFRSRSGTARFELELPISRDTGVSAGANDQSKPRMLTLMLVDPDPSAQRALLNLLASRGHRTVPTPPHEALELAQRLRFQAVFWAHHPGGSWTESQKALLAHVPAFILVSDAYDPELARNLEQDQGFVLPRPIQEAEVDRILSEVSARTAQVQ
jgi:signal transduction histidine kinase/CheY-like chemotaxis protein